MFAGWFVVLLIKNKIMRLLANENFPSDSSHYLKDKGFDLKAIGADHAGIKDEDVMKLAIAENRIILTFDKDYGELIFKHGYAPEHGVIFLRLESYESDEPGKIIEQMLATAHFDTTRKLTVFDGKFIRQRAY
jgi:predicted nuclease of predicted toxin-antitoxin system